MDLECMILNVVTQSQRKDKHVGTVGHVEKRTRKAKYWGMQKDREQVTEGA